MGITLSCKGNFTKSVNWLTNIRRARALHALEKYGQECVDALAAATPVRSGLTASSWHYEIKQKSETSLSLVISNSHIEKGVNIAIILQYGHGTGTGGWVEGQDYINPAIQPIFDDIANKIWKEMQ